MISVALCTFNGEAFLERQLESIDTQTLTPDELIISDDGSTDGTIEIAQAFQKRAKFRVTIMKNHNNLGVVKNFEQAIGACSGQYLFLCDQDDVWDKKKIETQVGVLRANPQLGYVFSDAILINENGENEGYLWGRLRIGRGQITRFNADPWFQIETLLRRNIVTGATMAFRKECLPYLLPFPENSQIYIHDGWSALNMSLQGFMGFALDSRLIAYRQHSRQLLGVPKFNLVNYFKCISRTSEIGRLRAKHGELKQLRLHASNAAGGNLSDRTCLMIDGQLAHLERRIEILLDKNRFHALQGIFGELLSGGYKKCPANSFCWLKDAFIVLAK